MFQNSDMTIGDWFLFYIVMAIPILNVIMFFVILFSSAVNKSLKNMLWTQVLFVIITVVLLFTVFSVYLELILDALNSIL